MSTGGVGSATGQRWFDLGDAGGIAAGLGTAIASLTWPDSEAALKGCVCAFRPSAPSLCAPQRRQPAQSALLARCLRADHRPRLSLLRRRVTVCRTAVTFCAEPSAPAGMRSLAATDLLRGSVNALTLGSNAAHQAEIVALTRDVLVKLGPVVEDLRGNFAAVTQSSVADADALMKQLAASASDKQQRTKLRAFLLAAGGSTLSALTPQSACAATAVRAKRRFAETFVRL